MTTDNDWLIGEYFTYNYDDVGGAVVGAPASIVKDKNNRIYAYWNYGPEFEYCGEIVVMDGNIRIFSTRKNKQEYVMTVLPEPKNHFINRLWGVSAGTIWRGNKPAVFRFLLSRDLLSEKQVQNEFQKIGATMENSIFVMDYDAEKHNRHP